jgi:hypothetical protein
MRVARREADPQILKYEESPKVSPASMEGWRVIQFDLNSQVV